MNACRPFVCIFFLIQWYIKGLTALQYQLTRDLSHRQAIVCLGMA
jgi:uncharacterized protein (DUF1919 family)